MDALVEEVTELKIPVLQVNGDRPIQKTFQELCHVLKPFLFKREEQIESKLVSFIPEENLKAYEKSFVYRKSRFDRVSPSDRFTQKREFPVLYRNRIYYAKSQEEQEKIGRHPLQNLHRHESVPSDISYLPSIFVIGMGKTGKTALAKEIQKKLNLVHIKVAHVIREFMQNPFSQTA